jgi:hypothetical protein
MTMIRSGIFSLSTPTDLLNKARHDLERLRHNRCDTYAAFDFFVAARHLPEWLYYNDTNTREALFAQHIELRTSRHIADGGKHFIATDRKHRQVTSTSESSGAWAPGAWARNAWAGTAWATGDLVIDLDPADPGTVALGPRISALELAERTIRILEALVP